jgi:hypothetical protein
VRAREYLFEDNRSTIEKLEELIAHPGTEETVRLVALSRLDNLRSKLPAQPRSRITTSTNVSEEDLDRPFLTGLSLGTLYDSLNALSPAPNEILFGRQGVIHMMVPPPFMGKTKQQYMNDILSACPGARHISGNMIEGRGYLFIISYL